MEEQPKSKIFMPSGESATIATSSKFSGGNVLDSSSLRDIALMEPLVFNSIKKKVKDELRNWHKINNMDGTIAPDFINTMISDFVEKTNMKQKFYIAGLCSGIYGDGFIEVTYFKDNNPLYLPPKDGLIPSGLNVINPENIKGMEKESKSGNRCFVYRSGSVTENKYVHPDRLIHIREDFLPEQDFGISKINVLRNILKSKCNSDIASGEILAWFSHGIMTMKINDMTEEQQKRMLEYFKKHPNYFVFDEDYEFDIKNPSQINPDAFYKYFYTNIARGLEMPVNMISGEGSKSGEGGDVSLSDYYNDIENIRKIIYSPLIIDLYKQIVESHGKIWKYELEWNPIYVDELSEAKILQTRTYSATQLKNSAIIDNSEARRMMCEGEIELDPDLEIEVKPISKPNPITPSSEPNINPQPEVKAPTIKPLSEEQKIMIQKVKELGAKELIEQEKRLKEAENLIKKKLKVK
jgi:hypothetical protein